MDLGVNFAAKLEPFLLVGKSMKGAAAAKLVQDATSAPGVFVFSELLDLPNIQEVTLAILMFLTSLMLCLNSFRKASNMPSFMLSSNYLPTRPIKITSVSCQDFSTLRLIHW
jgi:hypothetical protein